MDGITSQAIQRRFVVVNDTAPSSPFEGQLWRDTSSNTLKQYNGSSWISVQSSPDNKTIRKNQSGELEAFREVTVIGDFENGNSGSWTAQAASGLLYWDRGGAEGSNYSWGTDSYYGTGNLYRTLNLSGLVELEFHYRNDSNGSPEIRVEIGGNTVYSDSSIGSSWSKVTVDISNYSGDQEIRFKNMDANEAETTVLLVDRIKLKSKLVNNATVYDGEGGH